MNYEHKVVKEALNQSHDFSKYVVTARALKWVFTAIATLKDTYALSGKEHLVAKGVLNYYKLISEDGTDEWKTYVNTGRTGRIDTREVRACLMGLTNTVVISAELEPIDAQRYFSKQQREEIFNNARGKCQECGLALSATNWHADHIKPHSHGGKTVVSNGRALCSACNRQKGSTWKELFKEPEGSGGLALTVQPG